MALSTSFKITVIRRNVEMVFSRSWLENGAKLNRIHSKSQLFKRYGLHEDFFKKRNSIHEMG